MDQPFYVEQRTLIQTSIGGMASDMAHHLYARRADGKVLVVASEPFVLLRIMRKHWLRLLRLTQRERAQTLNGPRIALLSSQIARMKKLKFVIKLPPDAPRADVFFITPDQISRLSNSFYTIYVICKTDQSATSMLRGRVTPGGLLVIYDITEVG